MGFLGKTMSFSLKLSTPLADNVRETGAEQLRIALEALAPGSSGTQDVHGARKALKRFRALLRLTAPAMTNRDFRRFDRGAAEAARAFSPVRDIQVMMETVTRLAALGKGSAYKRAIDSLKSRLRMKREQAETNLHDPAARLAVANLAELGGDFETLKLDIDGFDTLAEGLAGIYGQGREAMAHALQSGGGDDYHEWRKGVQRHWRHLQFLSPLWPAIIAPQVKLAHDLAEALGDDHDLATLLALIERERPMMGRGGGIGMVAEVCAREQAALRQRAERMGRRLFAEKPKALGRRFAAYWETAEHETVPPDKAAAASPAPEEAPSERQAAGAGVSPPPVKTAKSKTARAKSRVVH